MKLATYIIAQGDTIATLAQSILGDPSQEDMLIEINRLRYPYISDNPTDQFARPKGSVFLVAEVMDPSSISISNPNGIVISPGDTVLLMQGTVYGSAVVQSASGNVVVFNQTINGTYDQSAVAMVYPNQQNISTQVLRTGDTLLYPSTSIVSSGTTSKPYSLAWGTDWMLDENGFLVKSGGGIAKVSGIDNLKQALRMRLQTPLGSLPLHPNYGNELFNILGEASEPHFKSLASFYIEECVKQDIRVRDAKVTDLTITNDQVLADLSFTPAGSQSAINQPISIPIGGIS